MTRPSLHTARAAALLLGACAALSALAADPVTDAMQDAYAPYRSALFKTNGASQAESQQTIAQAQQSWVQLSAQFGSAPPAPYDRDAAFAASLAEVAKVYARAAEQISANQLAAAHETLEHARDVMAEVRRRNQVIVYSDHMNAYHAEMELVINDGSKVLSQPNGIPQLTATAGALSYLAGRLTTEAPEKYTKNDEFVSLAKAVQKSVNDLQAALFAQDAPAAKAAIQKLKAPYGKLFLKFG
jgi:hypothetical protein